MLKKNYIIKILFTFMFMYLCSINTVFGEMIDPVITPNNVQANDYNIISNTTISVNDARIWAKSRGASEDFVKLANLYFKYSEECGNVNPVIAYVQSAKETNFGKFTGVLDASFKNPCGMKTVVGGGNYDKEAHQRFLSWDDGVKAHLDHLALYAGACGYPKANTTDPRHFNIIRGKCTTVKSLGGNWAPSLTYGDEIIADYNELLSFSKIRIKTIVIDPGHNYGGDLGAKSNIDGEKYEEVELNMELSLCLKDELERRGFNVVLTRQPDDREKLSLNESLKNRVVIANNSNADLFISIHHNSSEIEEANGIEVYYSSLQQGDDFKGGAWKNKIEVSKKLSEKIVNKVSSQMHKNNRGSKDSEFFIKSTDMPSVLVESGFITNKEEAERLSNKDEQKEMSRLISDAIIEII